MTAERIDRIIVVGIDGLEPAIVDELFASGELPHLARLREQGGYCKVATTAPAQTPVAWSSFATGLNPGGHGIFDFVTRNPENYELELALNHYEQPSPFRPPQVVNRRKGTPFWERLDAQGIQSTILRCPCTYPPQPISGRLLSGMGVPDLRGSFGTGTFYTTESEISPGEAEFVVSLSDSICETGTTESHLIGPRHPRTRTNIHVPLTIERSADPGSVTLRSSGIPETLILEPGCWSSWIRVTFRIGLLQSVNGLVRFYLVRSDSDHLSFYASPVQFDPDSPPFPISHPTSYAGELSKTIGLYHTTGLPEDHAALTNGRIDEAAFLSQCDDLWREREAMFETELSQFQSGVLYCLFDMTDRIQHLFWRYRDPTHPANLDRPFLPDSRHAIREAYLRADAVVGRALEAADDRTLVVVLSDHGFSSFRRGVNLNTWLFENGLLSLSEGHHPGDLLRAPLESIDWNQTQAYAIGLGGLFLNLKGREGQGVVAPGEAEQLKTRISRALIKLRDPLDGSFPIRNVATRESLYQGASISDAPDLAVLFEEGYRVSWGSAMGHLDSTTVVNNTRLWAGDHIIDPALVPGVLFMNRRFHTEGATLLDLAPTFFNAFGLPVDPVLEGRSLIP